MNWIACSECLPGSGRALAYSPKAIEGAEKVTVETANSLLWWHGHYPGTYSHWMPLPEPPPTTSGGES